MGSYRARGLDEDISYACQKGRYYVRVSTGRIGPDSAYPVSKWDPTSYPASADDPYYLDVFGLTIATPPVVLPPHIVNTPVCGPTTMIRGRYTTVYGFFRPRHSAGTPVVKLQGYRYERGRWVLRKTWTTTTSDFSSYSRYSARVAFPYVGRWRLRGYAPGDVEHRAGYSAYDVLTVK